MLLALNTFNFLHNFLLFALFAFDRASFHYAKYDATINAIFICIIIGLCRVQKSGK